MDKDASGSTIARQLERKIVRARIAAVVEQAWVRLWVLLGVVGLFILVSYADVWPRLSFLGHVALLAAFGAAVLLSLGYIARISWPSREEAIRRIERVSGVAHRPASSYEDTLSGGATTAETQAIWQAHRARMAAMLAKLRSGAPEPRTDRRDPYALRAVLLLVVGVATALLGAAAPERILSAFTFRSDVALAQARLDAWVAPPAYALRPPIMLADGSGNRVQLDKDGVAVAPEVPERSALIVRASGMNGLPLVVEIDTSAPDARTRDGERIEAEATKDAAAVREVRYELRRTATVRVLAGTRELAAWRVEVTPDQVPKISLSRPPELTPRGSLKITFKAEDDFGVASGKVDLKKVPPPPRDPEKDWAKPEPPKGPRWPLTRPPELTLKLPKANAKEVSGHTYFETASHPWAGMKVLMTLEATDVAGQVGRSVPFEMILPERQFTKPLARAVAEQRRKLLEDHRYRDQVRKALAALTLAPEGFIEDLRIYLGLRSVYHRLGADRTRAGMQSSIEQLWHIALRIEDGSLSDAERRLKDAKDKLSKALEDGASEEEIKELMAELRQAMADFMKQLAQQNGQDGQQQNGQNPDQQMIGQEDLERMMRNLEEMAKSGAREQAQQLLSEMQDLMERMQSGQMNQAEQQRNQEMMEMLEELGGMVGDQQKLMDETFEERRGGDEEGGQQRQRQGQRAPPNMKGMGEDGRESENGSPSGQNQRAQQGRRSGQQGQSEKGQGEQGQAGQGMGQGQGKGSLSERQRELRERLAELQKEMREKGAPGAGDQLGNAEDAMEAAEQALEDGDLAEATEQQGRALDEMRQSAQSMAQQMMQNMPQRYGQGGDSPRDPLGRPQRSRGPDQGTSVKVPDQIDVQRAREILEELRRRIGESTRVPLELEYLERLLERF